jgi:uncharacterized iron-regulated protein
MPVFRAWPFVFVALSINSLVGCDGDAAMMGSTNADAGADGAAAATLTGPPPSLSASPGYAAPPKLTFRVLAGRGNGSAVNPDAMLAALREADAVCLGETHDSFAVHSMQLLLVDRLRQVASTVDPNWAMGFEMFQRPFQSTMDDFAAGRIAEGTFRTNSEYDVRWKFPWELYKPLLLQGIQHGHQLLALDMEKELLTRISSVGLQGLSTAEMERVPELVLTSEPHRIWFRPQLGIAHGVLTEEVFERLYTSQVVKDETMAETSTRWLKAATGRHVAIVAGRGHCIDMAIPDRMRRRGVAKVVGLQILEDIVGDAESAVLSDPADFVVAVSAVP